MKNIFALLKQRLWSNRGHIFVFVFISFFSLILFLIYERNYEYHVIPYRYFNYRLYSKTKIVDYTYDRISDQERINLVHDSYSNSILAKVVVAKNNLETDTELLVDENEIVINGRKGIKKTTKRVEGGSRSNTYNYYTTKFTFTENGYYYISTISDESQFLLNILLKELVANIIPHQNEDY